MNEEKILKFSGDAKQVFELWNLLVNLRHHTKKWENGLDPRDRERKIFWEKKSDDFIRENS